MRPGECHFDRREKSLCSTTEDTEVTEREEEFI